MIGWDAEVAEIVEHHVEFVQRRERTDTAYDREEISLIYVDAETRDRHVSGDAGKKDVGVERWESPPIFGIQIAY